MYDNRRRAVPWLALGALLGISGCQSPLAEAIGVREIDAPALAALRESGSDPLLIDLREPEKTAAGHLTGAVAVRIKALAGYLAARGPAVDRPIVLMCNSGRMSLWGASIAAGRGYVNVASLRGGMQGWIAAGLPVETGELAENPFGPPRLFASELEQVAQVVSGFGFKPTYMFLSLLLGLLLIRRREPELRLICWGLLAFFAGEWACAANYYLADMQSDRLEVAHGLGMVAMNAFVPWGVFRILDDRVLRLSDPEAPCLAVRFCRHCSKRGEGSCPVQRFFLFAAPALLAVSLMPLSSALAPVDAVIDIFGTDVRYEVNLLLQLLQFRLYPLLAAALFATTFGLLWLGGKRGLRISQAAFFFGLGFACFSLLRFMLLQAYSRMPVWNDFWEEATELLAVLGVGVLLLLLRRQFGLWTRSPQEPAVS